MVDIKSKSKITLVPDTDVRWDLCRNGDIDARNSIVVDCLPIVDQIVGSLMSRFPPHVEHEELRSYGIMGLIAAVESYDPNRATFRTHAAFRIRNYVFDELRKQDWAPKTFRARAKEVERTAATLRDELSTEPSDAQVGEALGKSAQYVRQIRQESRASYHKSMSELVDSNGEPFSDVKDPKASVEVQHTANVHLQAFTHWVNTLTERQQIVWALRWHYEQAPCAIADHLGCRTSTILAELREILQSFGTFVENMRAEVD